MNTFAGFIWLLIYAWLIVFFLHQVIGGILGLFHRGIEKRNALVVSLKEKP